MNLSLTPELKALIQRKVDSGLYANASEVVRDALRRMDATPASDPWAPLREFLAPRMAAAERGEYRAVTKQQFMAIARAQQ